MYIIRNLKHNSDCIKMIKIETEVDIIRIFCSRRYHRINRKTDDLCTVLGRKFNFQGAMATKLVAKLSRVCAQVNKQKALRV